MYINSGYMFLLVPAYFRDQVYEAVLLATSRSLALQAESRGCDSEVVRVPCPITVSQVGIVLPYLEAGVADQGHPWRLEMVR